jgi:multiple sugar transport system ATP-binding protein
MNFMDVTINDANGTVWVDAPGFRVKIPAERAERLRPYKGQRVTIGIRPEDIRLATGADSADLTFDAVVEVVEPLGSEILLDVKIGPSMMVARVEPTVRVKMNEGVKLALNPAQLHFFDTKTEQAV